ncbi:MAG: hypothetical protein U5L96_07180 [Owenweeksia sp.]|nr:hypothetical protein [Owenweeksia sp.]
MATPADQVLVEAPPGTPVQYYSSIGSVKIRSSTQAPGVAHIKSGVSRFGGQAPALLASPHWESVEGRGDVHLQFKIWCGLIGVIALSD